MEVAYTPKAFADVSPYAPVGEGDHDHNEFINTEANVDDMAELAPVATYNDDSPSPFNTSDSPTLDLGPVAPLNVDPANVPIRDASPVLHVLDDEDDNNTNHHHHHHHHHNTTNGDAMHETLTLSRSKPIAKPNRIVTRNDEGMYECRWHDCTEETRTFARKCEWSKHMDKHERPYVCTVKGCEKIQGFTYSGGLLRHEREVHGKHGGPKKALNCPHTTCKRNMGKGFSRMENLQEHLRRCHRRPSAQPSTPGAVSSGGGLEHHDDDSNSDVATAAFAAMTAMSPPDASALSEAGGGGGGGGGSSHKRKRSHDDEGERAGRERALLEDNERLRAQNEELERQLQEQKQISNDMRAQLQAMQATISHALSLPQLPV